MTAWLVQSLLGSALLMAGVMLVRPVVPRRLGPRMAYGLWLLPLVRLVLPVQPIWTVPGTLIPAAFGPGLDGAATGISEPHATVLHAVNSDAVAKALLVVWALGAVIHLGWRLAAYVRFVQRAEAASVGTRLVREGISIQTSALVCGPVAAGVWKRRIFLPLDFEVRFDAEQRRLILAHELAHHRRRDIAWNFAALIVVSLHWFNPLAHHAYRLYRLDQELACDADVVSGSPALRLSYGALLAQAVWQGETSPICSLSKAAQLKRRLAALAGAATPSSRFAWVALAPLALTGLLVTAPITLSPRESHTPLDGSAAAARAQFLVLPPDPLARETAAVIAHDARSLRGHRAPSRARFRPSPAEPPAPVAAPVTIESVPQMSSSPGDRLAARRLAGLLRSRPRLADPARTARDRGRPVFSA